MKEDTEYRPAAGIFGFPAIIVAISLGALACFTAAWCTLACSGSPSAEQQTALAEDSLGQKACVDQAEAGVGRAALKAAIDRCRDAVKARRDGGAP